MLKKDIITLLVNNSIDFCNTGKRIELNVKPNEKMVINDFTFDKSLVKKIYLTELDDVGFVLFFQTDKIKIGNINLNDLYKLVIGKKLIFELTTE